MVREGVRMKKKGFRDMLSQRTPEAVAGYRQAALSEAMQRVRENFKQAMEKDFQVGTSVSGRPSGTSRGGYGESSKLCPVRMGLC